MNDHTNAPTAFYFHLNFIISVYRRLQLQRKKEKQVPPWLMKMVCQTITFHILKKTETWLFKESVHLVLYSFLYSAK